MKPSIAFFCTACEGQTAKWVGQCPSCGEWNSLVRRDGARDTGGNRPGQAAPTGTGALPQPLSAPTAEASVRLTTGLSELDRALGGGIVPGSVTLLGGDPGIGKSTLLLQVAAHVASVRGVLYASGEESVSQVGLRAQRLGLSAASLSCVAENDLQGIIALANERKVA